MSNALQTIDEPQVRGTALTPMDMLHQAVSSGANVEVMEKLLNLQERWEKNQARKAFDAAMAALRENMPEVIKNREVDYTSQKGRTNYRHEDLPAVTRALSPVMASLGLSFRWKTDNQPNSAIAVTCIISHRDGHSEETTLSAAADASGNKNSIQAIGSTVTYLQRYTLKAAIGVAAAHDDDGRSADETIEDTSAISQDQVRRLSNLIDEVGADVERFCKFMRVDSLPRIAAKDFDRAVKALEDKRRRA